MPGRSVSNFKKGLRSTLIGIVVSAVLAMIKGVGGIVGNSYALVADAIESTTDIITSGMLWIGLRWSAKAGGSGSSLWSWKG